MQKNALNSTVPMTKKKKKKGMHVCTHIHTPHPMHTDGLFQSWSPSTSHTGFPTSPKDGAYPTSWV